MSSFAHKRCVPCDAGTPPMSTETAQRYLQEIPGWMLDKDRIVKEFRFRSYLDGIEFAYPWARPPRKRITIRTFSSSGGERG